MRYRADLSENTAEMLSRAPSGAVAVTKDGLLAWRKCSASKMDWEALRPTSEGWKSREPAERGSRVFNNILKIARQEPVVVIREKLS